MVTESTHIDGGMIDLELTDVPDAVLKQPIASSVCTQECYLKNSRAWEFFRRDVKGLN